MGVHGAQAVGSDEPNAIFTCDAVNLLLHLPSAFTFFVEARCFYDDGLNALLAAFFHHLRHHVGRGENNGKINLAGYFRQAGISFAVSYVLTPAVYRVEFTIVL